MTNPRFFCHQYIDTNKSSYELWARIFRALADCESFAVTVNTQDVDGNITSVYFWSDKA